MKFEQYTDQYQTQFEDMFVDYFVNDFGAPFPEEMIREKIVADFRSLNARGIAPTLLAIDDEGDVAGFVTFQVDSEDSDWNDRPGWGFIRETHVNRGWRRHGVGTALVGIACNVMKQSGATDVYLTTEGPFEFWENTGWKRSGEAAPNGGEILTKTL